MKQKNTDHKSFVLSDSPIKSSVGNAIASAFLLGIVVMNVAVLLDAQQTLQTCLFL